MDLSLWIAEAALEYIDFLDEDEPLDGNGLVSENDGSTISLPIDGRLEISGKEDENALPTK